MIYLVVYSYLDIHRNVMAFNELEQAENLCEKLNLEYQHMTERYKIEELIVS